LDIGCFIKKPISLSDLAIRLKAELERWENRSSFNISKNVAIIYNESEIKSCVLILYAFEHLPNLQTFLLGH
jgi:hypothetical protein